MKKYLQTMLRHEVGNKIQTAKDYFNLLGEKYEDEELIDKSKNVIDEAQNIIEKVEKLKRIDEEEEIQEDHIQKYIKKFYQNITLI